MKLVLATFFVLIFLPSLAFACMGLVTIYDTNKDGVVTADEFALKNAEMKNNEGSIWARAAANEKNRLQQQFSAQDVNKDGFIDLKIDFLALDTFANGFIDSRESGGQEMAFSDAKAFSKIDANKDSKITFQEYFNYEQARYKKELTTVEERYSGAVTKKLFETYDANHDGLIDSQEVKARQSNDLQRKGCM